MLLFFGMYHDRILNYIKNISNFFYLHIDLREPVSYSNKTNKKTTKGQTTGHDHNYKTKN